jgi:hypothetical protein
VGGGPLGCAWIAGGRLMQHSFDIEHAAQYGLQESIMICNFEFWIAKNAANKRHIYDGKVWTYNSVKAFGELFPYFSTNQIRRSIDSLVNQDVLVTGNFNPSSYDRTTWYTFSDSFSSQIHLAKTTNGIGKNNKTLTSTDINTDAEPVGFTSFYEVYPKKTAKPNAIKAFKAAKLKDGELDSILIDIETRKASDDWTKENGKYIPMPATYLNQRRWEDGETAHTSSYASAMAGAI